LRTDFYFVIFFSAGMDYKSSKHKSQSENDHLRNNNPSSFSLISGWNDMSFADSRMFSLSDLNTLKTLDFAHSKDEGLASFCGNVYPSESDVTVSMESGQWNFSDEPSFIKLPKPTMPIDPKAEPSIIMLSKGSQNWQRQSRWLETESSEIISLTRPHGLPVYSQCDDPFCKPAMSDGKTEELDAKKNIWSKITDVTFCDLKTFENEDSKKPSKTRQICLTEEETDNKLEPKPAKPKTLIPLKDISSSLKSKGNEKMAKFSTINANKSASTSEMSDRVIETIERQLTLTLEHGEKLGLNVLKLEQVFSKHEQSVGTLLAHAPRILSLISMFGNEKWFRVCCTFRGRILPWQPMLILAFWVFSLFLLHTYGNGLISGFGWALRGWMYRVLGISVGFLLKQHATIANDRWIEARKVWENIIDTTRTLVIILVSTSECRKLLQEAVSHLIGCPICIKNYIMGSDDDAWKLELMMVLPQENCVRIMKCRKRTRATFCLYACQRVVETLIKYELLTRPVVRDINPAILKLSQYTGDCSRIRYTQVPYGYFLHIRGVLVIYLMFLPLMLMGIPDISWEAVILYLVLISYSYAGLEGMATEILNPFGRDESDHPLDLYCYLNIFDTRFMIGDVFNKKSNFVESIDTQVVPNLQTWLIKNVPGYQVIMSISEKIKIWKLKKIKRKKKKQRHDAQLRGIPFDQFSELVYELYHEEKEEQEERERKRRIREDRKHRHTMDSTYIQGLII